MVGLMSLLGPEPEKLAPLPREFLRAVSALLEVLAPPLVDREMTKASVRGDGVEVVIAHAEVIAYSIWAQAEKDTILVGCSAMHEERGSASEALALVAALLCGEREVAGYDGVALRPDFGVRKP
jgi:hypothetical protein